MKKAEIPVYKEGQFVCVLLPSKKNGIPDKWSFGEISKIHPRKPGEEAGNTVAEVYLYGLPEASLTADTEERWEYLHPTVSLTREAVILNRLAAKMLPKKDDRSSRPETVRFKELCPANFDRFRERLTEGRDFSFKARASSW